MNGSEAERDRQATIDAEAQRWMLRLRSGDAGLQIDFEQWFAADPAHADAYDRLLAGWQAAGRLPRVSKLGPRWRPWLMAIAASLLLVIGVGALSLIGLGRSPAAAVELTSGVGEISMHRLPDGSAVTLDTDTQIDATFSPASRRVRLVRGRARFEVAADPRRPFIVEGNEGLARTNAGTIDAALDGDAFTVDALSGGFILQEGNAPAVALTPHQRAVIMPARRIAPSMIADPNAARWVTGMLSFDDAPLRTVVAAANRYSTTKIVLADEGVAMQRFTGTFHATDLTGLAHMLAAAFHLTLARDAKGNLVLAFAATSGPAPHK